MKTRKTHGAAGACSPRFPAARLPALLLALIPAALPVETFAQPAPGATRYVVPAAGAPASYVQFPRRPAFDHDRAAGAITIEGWVRIDHLERAGDEGGHPLAVNLTPAASGETGGWALTVDRSGYVVFLMVRGGESALFASSRTLDFGRWMHVAVTVLDAGGPVPGRVRIYIDGGLDREYPAPAPLPIGTNPGPFSLGSPLPGSWIHSICLDEMRLWARELSGEDIRTGLLREVRGAPGLRAVFPDGGREEIVSGLRGAIFGRVSEDCWGIIQSALDVPGSSHPFRGIFDGIVDASEYAISSRLTVHYPDPAVKRDGTASFFHTPSDLHMGLDFTRLPIAEPALPVLRLFFHTAGAALKTPGPSDLAIAVRLDGGGSWVEYGAGEAGFADCRQFNACPDGLWEAKVGIGANGMDGGPSVEIRVSKKLLDKDPGNLRVALGHFGFAGLNDNPQNPAAQMAPGSAVWNQPSSWIPLRLAAPATQGKGTCADPIALPSFAPLPIVRTLDLSATQNGLSSSPCLPLPHPGPEQYLRFTPPYPGTYRIAAYPADPDDNIALWVGKSCPPRDGDCLGGADAGGPGKAEVIEAALETIPYIIAVDGSFAPGGGSIAEVHLRIDVHSLVGEPLRRTSVVDVRGGSLDELPAVQQVLLETWEVDAKGLRVIGVAEDEAISALGRQGYGVDRPRAGGTDIVQGGPQPEPPTIRFDRFRYDLSGSDGALLALDADPAGLPAVQTAYVVNERTEDIEAVQLERRGGRYVSAQPLKFTAGISQPLDGVLGAEPGSFLVALWHDPRVQGDSSALSVGFAMLKGRPPLGAVQLQVDPEVKPPVRSTPGRAPQEPPRPLGALADASGVQLSLGTDQLVVRKDDPDLGDFLKRYDARVVDDGLAKGVQKNPYALVRFDPGKVDLGDAEVLLELIGANGQVRISDPSLLPLLVVIAEERLRGHAIEPSFLIEYHGQPRTREAGGLNAFQEAFATDCIQGLQRAWLYTSIFDRETADGMAPVRVAVVDSNFCPGIAEEASVIGGYDFYNDVDSPFGRASVIGGGGGSFHGTAMASVIGGRLDNGAGAAGSGGLVSELLLYNVGGTAYLFDAARAIRQAVADGGRVVNMSFGFPCALAGIDFCDPAVGTFLCVILGPVLDAALLAAGPLLPLPPGGGGPACFYLAAFLSGARGALTDAIDDAERAGVVLVASAGNTTDFTGQGTVEEYGIIPAGLPNVIAVGVAVPSEDIDGDGEAETYANTQFHGSAVDVWVLESPPHFLPAAEGDCPRFSVQYFAGTSGGAATVSGVIAMMRAVNPSLSPAQIRDILAASTVDAPGTDPRVRRFLRSDLAVMTAGTRPVGPFPDPMAFSPALAFDERDETLPGYYGAGGCLDAGGSPWPPILRPSNDEPASPLAIPFPDDGFWREAGFGLHRFGGGGARDLDHYRFPPRIAGLSCDIHDVAITVEYLRAAGAMFPVVPGFEGSLSTVDVGDRSRTTWTGRGVFVSAPIDFQVGGSDNLYSVEIPMGPMARTDSDRLEHNNEIGRASRFSAADFALRRDPDFTERSLRITGLNFHCPDDVDFFRIQLPPETEDCRDLEDTCGIGTPLGLSQLFVTAPGAGIIRLYDPTGARVVQSGSVIRMRCPRAMGYSTLLLEIRGNGRQYRPYELSVRYQVPSEIADTSAIEEALNDVLCCDLATEGACSGPGPGWGGPDSIGIDLWSPWLEGPRLIDFGAFCPAEVCNPAPAQYHRIGWQGGAPFDMLVEIPAAAQDRFAATLLDGRAGVVGIAVPMSRTGAGGGGEAGAGGGPIADRLMWGLSIPDLPAGDYYLRIRGLEPGEVYALENVDPPKLPAPPAAPSDLVVKSSTANAIEISWKDGSSDEVAFEVERLEPGASGYVPAARLPSGTTSYTDGGLAPDTIYRYRVRALGIGGPSGYSNEAAGSTLPEDGAAFHRGDADGSGQLDITDPLVILGHLFLGEAAPGCFDAADANDDGFLDISDPVQILGYLFLGTIPPAAPGPPGLPCGKDPTPDDDLGCEKYEGC